MRFLSRNRRALFTFALGAVCYPAIELIWRGRTHWSMALTGGACLLAIGRMNGRLRGRVGWPGRCALGSLIITSFELSVGLVVNRCLKWNVWDYSRVPGNLLGQICPLFCLYWFLLNIPLLGVCRHLGY